jgi:hypothetical protein
MSINRSWQLIIIIVDLEIDSGAKIPPLPKIMIPGAIVDEKDFFLDQVSTKSLVFLFNTSFIAFRLILGVGVDLKKVGPRQMRAVQGQPAGTRDCHLYRLWVPPLHSEKTTIKSIDPPFLLYCVGRMYVQWREREHEAANELVVADPNVVVVLTQCGLVKFFLCPFMHVAKANEFPG